MSTFPKTKVLILTLSVIILVLSARIVHQKIYTLSADEFAEVYVELVISYKASGSDASKLTRTKKEILRRHHLTSQEINRFIAESNQHPETWAIIWEKIVQRLEQEQQRLSNHAPSP